MPDRDVAVAVAAIQENFERLRLGSMVSYNEVFSQEAVQIYSRLHQLDFPVLYRQTGGAEVVPPGLVMFHAVRVFGRYDGPELARNGIFVEGKRRYSRPVRIGEKVTFKGEIVDKYVLRGFHYIVTRWDGTSSDGHAVVEGLSRTVLGYVRSAQAEDSEPRRELFILPPREARTLPRSRRRSLEAEVGHTLAGPTLVARVPPPEAAVNPIMKGAALHQHRDELARKAGLRGGMVINEFHLSHVFELLLRRFGLQFLYDGEIEAKFVRPLLDGEPMTPKAQVVGAEGGRLQLDWWVESNFGEKVAVGRASCCPYA